MQGIFSFGSTRSMQWARWRQWGSVLLLATLLQACALPSLSARADSYHLSSEVSLDTAFGRALADDIQAHPGLSAVYPVADALDAFVARMLMAQHAQRSLDV